MDVYWDLLSGFQKVTTTTDSDIYITSSISPCSTSDGNTQYTLKLYRDGITDKQVQPTGTYTCTGTGHWLKTAENMSPGTYYFRITVLYPWRDKRTYTAGGNVYYDGGHP